MIFISHCPLCNKCTGLRAMRIKDGTDAWNTLTPFRVCQEHDIIIELRFQSKVKEFVS